jgi:hypothetical protein
MVVTNPDELLLRHFEMWAHTKKRDVDVVVLAQLLELRDTYDDLEPTYWPIGSVEHLLLERWPAKGDVLPPDPGAVVDVLDAWFRFLRSTGRMSGRSGDPKELVKEARRAATRMGEVAADRENWSQTKSLMEFGRSQGIVFDGLESVEALQAALDETTRRWNALPVHERTRLMPLPGDEERDESEHERALRMTGVDDEIVALLLGFRHELPSGELPPVTVTGPQFARSPYVAQVLALADWVGGGQALTATEVLRLAPARAAYDALGLDAFTQAQLARHRPSTRDFLSSEAERPWRSARDIEALDRVWWAALSAGLIRIDGRKVVASAPSIDRDDEAWVNLGLNACVGLLDWLDDLRGSRAVVVVQALMRSYVGLRAWVSLDELESFCESWVLRPSWRDHHGWRESVDVALGFVADTGLLEISPDAVRLTEAGEVFVAAWLGYMGLPR